MSIRGLHLLLLCCLGACDSTPPPQAAPWVLSFGGPGREDGRFTTPRGLGVDAKGAWVVDRSGRIQRFDREGNHLRTRVHSTKRAGFPLGLLSDPSGGFLLCDTHADRLLRFDAEARPDSSFASDLELSLPQRIVRGPKGRLYVSEFGSGRDCRIRVLDPEGHELFRFGRYGNDPEGFVRPMGLAILRDRLYVADASDRILVHDFEGKLRKVIGSTGSALGQLRYPYGLCAHRDTLIVCEYANNRLQRFTPDGRSLGTYGRAGRGEGEFASPWDVCSDPEDARLWVCDTGNHRVVVLEADAIPWSGER